jgi:hypothetical protein
MVGDLEVLLIFPPPTERYARLRLPPGGSPLRPKFLSFPATARAPLTLVPCSARKYPLGLFGFSDPAV